MYINACFFLAHFMLSIELPTSSILRNTIVVIFVTIRVIMFIFLFYWLFLLHVLLFLSIHFFLDTDVTKPDDGNLFNFIIADIIAFIALLYLFTLCIGLLALPFILIKSCKEN